MTNTKEEMMKLVTRRLASKNVGDNEIAALAETVLNSKHKFVGVDPCTVGTCFDIEWGGSLREFDLATIIDDLPGTFHGADIRIRGMFPNERHLNVSITQEH